MAYLGSYKFLTNKEEFVFNSLNLRSNKSMIFNKSRLKINATKYFNKFIGAQLICEKVKAKLNPQKEESVLF